MISGIMIIAGSHRLKHVDMVPVAYAIGKIGIPIIVQIVVPYDRIGGFDIYEVACSMYLIILYKMMTNAGGNCYGHAAYALSRHAGGTSGHGYLITAKNDI